MTTGNKLLLCNELLGRNFEIREGKLVSSEIKNCLTGTLLQMGEEFGVRLARYQEDISLREETSDKLTSEDFLRVEAGHRMGKEEDVRGDDVTARILAQSKSIIASEFELLDWVTEREGTAQRMILRLRNPVEELEAQVGYQLRADEPYLRKWVDLTNSGPEGIWIVDVDVETFCASEWQSSHERGYPIFIGDDFFAGLEFPTWSKVASDDKLVLRHHPGAFLGPGESLTTKKAIIGVSDVGANRELFRSYLADIALARPGKAPVSLYNDWGSHGSEGATEKQSLNRASLMKRIKTKYGLKFDYYIVDDGWAIRPDEPWHLRRQNWPDGFGKFVEKLKELNTKLGLWMTFRCLAERPYCRKFKEGVFRLIDEYQLGWIKFDGGVTECADPGHGHLTTSEHSQEALFEALIELLDEIRKRNPEITIQHCWGINQSPWWVMHYDMLFGMLESIPHLGAIYVPALHLRESLDVGLDQAELVQYQQRFLPWHIIDDDGVYLLEPMEGWKNNLILSCLGRGNGRIQIYARLELLKEKDWIFLQAVWRLLEKEFSHFSPTQNILGIPEKGEVYGYAHFSEGKGFLVLHNPSFEERGVELKLADYLPQVDRESLYRLYSLHPKNRELRFQPEEVTTLRLAPFEVSLLEVKHVEQVETWKPPVLPSASAPLFESSRKLSDFQEDRMPKDSKSELQRMVEKIKFSLPDSSFSPGLKGWLDAPAHARWWVNPRGRTRKMCYRLDLGQSYSLSRVEIESAGFPPEYSLSFSDDLSQWWEIGPRKGTEKEVLTLPERAARYVKLVPYWEGDEAGDWGIVDVRFYQKDGEMIVSEGWFRNGLFSYGSRIPHIYRACVSFEELKSKVAPKSGLVCVPLQTKLEGKPWYGKPIMGYNVPHNNILLTARSAEQQFIFRPTPAVGFVTKGSWVTFTHPLESLAEGGNLELVAVVADAPEEVVLEGGVYWLSGKDPIIGRQQT